jgi:glucokinase
MNEALALDIGDTEIAAGVVDSAGKLLRHSLVPIPDEDDAERTFRAVANAVAQVSDGTDVAAIGIGSVGPIDTVQGTVSPLTIRHWQRFPLVSRVAELLPSLPITLATDGLCSAVGEHWVGAGKGSNTLLCMVVSTGVGGGLVIDGHGFAGPSGNAGHLGHVVVEADGDPCICGGRGCLQTVASGPALVRWARIKGWQAPDHAHAEHLAAAAKMGEEIARTAFGRAGRAVASAIASATAICDIDLVVVGGGVATCGDLLFDPIREALDKQIGLSFLDQLRVVPAALGSDAGLIGAASLALQFA